MLSVTINLYSQNSLYVGKVCLSSTPPISGATSCNETTHFFDSYINNSADSWSWDYGDSRPERTGEGRNPRYIPNYVAGNTYTITAKALSGTTILNQDSKPVKVGNYPKQPMFKNKLEKDSLICDGSAITLDPFQGTSAPNGVRYKWFPNGETTSTLTNVTESGCYTVEVIDNFSGCSRFATMNVKICYEESSSSGGGSEKWYFGHESGLEFTMSGTVSIQDSLENDGSLTPVEEIEDPVFKGNQAGNNSMDAEEAAAIVLDKGKQIVLYSDGKKLYSGEDDSEIEFIDGSPFSLPGNSGSQGLVLVPKPTCSACDFIYYYLFAVDETTGVLSYWEIDMRDNDRKGAIVPSELPIGIPVAVNISGKLAVERSGDDESYLISAFERNFKTLISLSIDSLGVHPPASITGTPDPSVQSEGYVAISSNGEQLAHGLIINGINHVEISSRDPQTNILTVTRRVDLGIAAQPSVYGLAFSPNGAFLYVTLKGDGSTIESKLLQINLSNDNIIEIASNMAEFGALGLGPKYGVGEKYVYLTIKNNRNIHYLQAPNLEGKDEVGFTLNSASPGIQVGGTPKLGFPNVVAPKEEDEGSGLGANYSGNCMNSPTTFTSQPICDPMKNEFDWIIDGKKFNNDPQPVHTFTTPGWKTIKLTVRPYKEILNAAGVVTLKDFCNPPVEYEGKVYIKPAPELNVPDPFYVCTDTTGYTTYTPQPTGGDTFTYLWMTGLGNPADQPNHTRPFFEFKLENPYKLDVTNNLGCTSKFDINTLLGCLPQVFAPNVITPNNDGDNDKFKVFARFIERPTLEIYNRWGDQIFQTDNLENDQWDGTYKNRPVASNQLYAYIIRYFSRDFPERGEQRQVGSVLVLRD